MMKLRGEAKKMEAELKKIHVEAEENGISVTVNAKQELVAVAISDELTDHRAIERDLIKAFNRAGTKAQQIGAQKMQEVMGGLKGLLGGE